MDREDLKTFFEGRLTRLVVLSETYAEDMDDEMCRILRAAIFSTYLDLRDLGQGDNALLLIRGGSKQLVGAGSSDR